MSDKQKAAPVKKGKVIDRKHNHTVPQGIAMRDSKWKDLGGGYLQRGTALVRKAGGKLVSATRREVDFHLAQQEQAQEQASA
jgi:hypothetical protein